MKQINKKMLGMTSIVLSMSLLAAGCGGGKTANKRRQFPINRGRQKAD